MGQTLAVAGGVALALAIGVAVSCRSTPSGAGAGLDVSEVAHGATSGITDQRLVIARDAETWSQLWAEHARLNLPTPPAPEVDFEERMVVAFFLGQRSSGGYGATIESCNATAAGMRIVVHESAPDPDAVVTTALTAPYHIVSVPRSEGARVLELHYAD